MKRLSKDQLAARSELVTRLRAAAIKIETAIDETNSLIDEYNVVLDDVESFRDEVVSEMETYYDERSESWQESDAGNNYADWKGQYESLDANKLDELEAPDGLKVLTDELEELPEQPD
jgi:hypothetical protein